MQNEYKENRMFDEMLKAARMRLAGRSAEDISEISGNWQNVFG